MAGHLRLASDHTNSLNNHHDIRWFKKYSLVDLEVSSQSRRPCQTWKLSRLEPTCCVAKFAAALGRCLGRRACKVVKFSCPQSRRGHNKSSPKNRNCGLGCLRRLCGVLVPDHCQLSFNRVVGVWVLPQTAACHDFIGSSIKDRTKRDVDRVLRRYSTTTLVSPGRCGYRRKALNVRSMCL